MNSDVLEMQFTKFKKKEVAAQIKDQEFKKTNK